MATRGRKPKPTAMKELEGNPGKHPLNTSEPKPNKKAPALDLCQYFEHKKLKGYADFFNSSSSFCCGVI